MKVPILIQFKDIKDNPLVFKNDKGIDSILTFADVFIEALLKPLEEDSKISEKEKIQRWEIVKTIIDAQKKQISEIDLEIQEVAKIKELVNKIYSALIVGQIHDILK